MNGKREWWKLGSSRVVHWGKSEVLGVSAPKSEATKWDRRAPGIRGDQVEDPLTPEEWGKVREIWSARQISEQAAERLYGIGLLWSM